MKIFVDTWGWVVLGDKNDPRHGQAVECYEKGRRAAGAVWTSNFVLDETLTLVFRRRPFSEASRFAKGLLDAAFINVEAVTEERFRGAFALREKLSDKPLMSFTDLTSMIIMKELGINAVLTTDAHFAHVGLGFHSLPDAPRNVG